MADIFVEYNFNNVPTVDSPNVPSCLSPCIEASDLSICTLTSGLRSTGGPDDSAFRTFSGWDATPYDSAAYFSRDSLWQWPATVSFTFQVDDQSQGSLTGFSADVKRAYSYSPDTIMASIFWEDNVGVIQQRNSGAIDISGATSWTTINFLDTYGTADLPSGLDFAGENFRVELYASGGTGGALYLDNVTLTGDCAPIPEPSSLIMLGVAGLVFRIRRRAIG
ncbi:MAG: PEP-CTERM sorting domain-containing protein [Prosthecobacter sp.]